MVLLVYQQTQDHQQLQAALLLQVLMVHQERQLLQAALQQVVRLVLQA
jgi:hypothetical protein